MIEALKKRYAPCEPIVLRDTKWMGLSETAKRQMFKRLSDKGVLKRYMSGVYYFPAKERTISNEAVLKKMYICNGIEYYGYQAGYYLAKQIGVTKREDKYLYIVTNMETSRGRFRVLKDRKVYLRKPYLRIQKENAEAAALLDFIREWKRYSDVSEEETFSLINKYVKQKRIDRQQLLELAPYYPDKVSAMLLKYKLG